MADKKFDPVSRSTWARLASAGRSPIAGKPYAAERMDQNPALVGRARGVDPDDAPPMKLATSPVTPSINTPTIADVFITLRVTLDMVQITSDPDRVGKLMAEAVRIASNLGPVLGVSMDVHGIEVRVAVDEDMTGRTIERKRLALHARLLRLTAA